MNDSHLGDSIFGSGGRGTPQGGGDAAAPQGDGDVATPQGDREATAVPPDREATAVSSGRDAPDAPSDPDATGPVPPPAAGRPVPSRRELRERDLQPHPVAPAPRAPRRRRPAREGRGPAVRGCLAMIVGALVVGAALIFAISTLGSSFLPHFGGVGALAGGGGGDYVGAGTGSVTITVAPGDSGTAIGAALQKAGVVKSATTFTTLAANDSEFGALQPGSYRMRLHMSSSDALTMLLDPKSKVAGGVTIPEGLWASEIYARLSKATKVPLANYAKVPASSLGLPAAAKGRVEGYLFPSTYDFPKGASATTQLRAMVTRFKQEVANLGIPSSRVAKITTVASLVEAEASRPQDGPKVARVVDNRIAQGIKLGLESTIHYVYRQRGSLTLSKAQIASTSRYNTYKYAGLPPGPIDNPGVAALKAALNPTRGNWTYFVTVDPSTGETLFTNSATQNAANYKRFQAWCTAHPGKC